MNIPDPLPASRHIVHSPVRLVALVFGIVFLLVGVAGFIPGITTHTDALHTSGHRSEAMLLGLFQVSLLHNVVHLLFGIVGVAFALATWPPAARLYLRLGGAVYLVLWIYGLLVDKESPANFVPLNTADDWLHFVLGVAMLALSFLPPYTRDARRGPRRTR